jgi:MipA family protein
MFNLILILILSSHAASEKEYTSLPLWEIGAGVGGIYFPHYPASDEYKLWGLPFPTYTYRGEILKADDRDGARASVFEGENWRFEMGGNIYSSVKGEENTARKGMDPIMWSLQTGPQFIYDFNDRLEFKLSVYQSFLTSVFSYTRTNGLTSEASLTAKFDGNMNRLLNSKRSIGELGVTLYAGTKEYLSTYFEVPSDKVTPTRPAFDARGGLLCYEASYYQNIGFEKWSYYLFLSRKHFDISANRESPLHKSDYDYHAAVGIIYTLGESVERVPYSSH